MVGLGRLELPTSRLSGVRSNQAELQAHSGSNQLVERAYTVSAFGILNGRDTPTATCQHLLLSELELGSMLDPNAKFLRKEVIQPQVPLRLPCYDFTPVANPTVVGCLLAVSAPASGRTNSHGVTGGVYKARERIHRVMLLRDY